VSYSLSFSNEFYANYGDSEGELQLDDKGRPTTLHSAIRLLLAKPSRERARLCASMRRTVAYLQEYPEEVIDRAREIDTCYSIAATGVPVYVTPFDNGYGVTVTVY